MEKLQAMLRLMESDEFLLITKTKAQEGITYNRDMTDSHARQFCRQVYFHIKNSQETLNAFKQLFHWSQYQSLVFPFDLINILATIRIVMRSNFAGNAAFRYLDAGGVYL